MQRSHPSRLFRSLACECVQVVALLLMVTLVAAPILFMLIVGLVSLQSQALAADAASAVRHATTQPYRVA